VGSSSWKGSTLGWSVRKKQSLKASVISLISSDKQRGATRRGGMYLIERPLHQAVASQRLSDVVWCKKSWAHWHLECAITLHRFLMAAFLGWPDVAYTPERVTSQSGFHQRTPWGSGAFHRLKTQEEVWSILSCNCRAARSREGISVISSEGRGLKFLSHKSM